MSVSSGKCHLSTTVRGSSHRCTAAVKPRRARAPSVCRAGVGRASAGHDAGVLLPVWLLALDSQCCTYLICAIGCYTLLYVAICCYACVNATAAYKPVVFRVSSCRTWCHLPLAMAGSSTGTGSFARLLDDVHRFSAHHQPAPRPAGYTYISMHTANAFGSTRRAAMFAAVHVPTSAPVLLPVVWHYMVCGDVPSHHTVAHSVAVMILSHCIITVTNAG